MTPHSIFPVSLVLFLAFLYPSYAQERLDVAEGAALEVLCQLRVEQAVRWRQDGGEVRGGRAGEQRGPGVVWATLRVPAARPFHAGLYTCTEPPEFTVRVRVLPSSESTSSAAPELPADHVLQWYDLLKPLVINCTLDAGGQPLQWYKNGTALSKVPELKDRVVVSDTALSFARSAEDDFGNYTCRAGSGAIMYELRGRPHVKLPANTNVVEGEKLKVTCRVIGKPYPPVTWYYTNADGNRTEARALLGTRVVFSDNEANVTDAVLLVDAAVLADAGNYTCQAGEGAASTVLRVKDKFAALWPFLGICAEVLVLCAVILLYERRRTKPEMEDSDTDNHDQKKS